MNLKFLRKIKKRKLFLSIALAINLLFSGLKPASAQNQNNPTNIEKLVGNNRIKFSIVYKFKEHPRLVAEAVKLENQVAINIKNLMNQLAENNLEPETKIEQIKKLTNVFSISNKNNGIVFVRQTNHSLEILGHSSSLNETKIINLLKEFGY